MPKPVRTALQYVIAIVPPIAIGQLLAGPLANQPVHASAFFLCTALTARFLGFGPAVASTLTSAWIFWTVVVATTAHPTDVQIFRVVLFATASIIVASVSRQRSKEVRLAEERYRTLVELSPDGIAVIDEHGCLLFANAALARILGTEERAQLLNRPLLEESRAATLVTGQTLPPFEQTWERVDGTTADVEVAAVPIERDGKFVGHLFVRDITDRKDAQRSVQQLSGRLLQLQDEERRQIASELHDTTAQSLVAVKLNLARVSRSGAVTDAAMKEAIEESAALTEQSIAEIRTLSYLLHPPIIDEAGLLASLQWYVHGFEQRSGIAATLDAPEEMERLPREMETALFRIVQEALTNVQRHSGSAVARLRLRREPNRLHLEIEDEGRGLPPRLRNHEGALTASGLGIAGIQQRVRELGGRLEIRSEDDGTKVAITIPVPDS
jgi:PAS domain S-box-containing protein